MNEQELKEYIAKCEANGSPAAKQLARRARERLSDRQVPRQPSIFDEEKKEDPVKQLKREIAEGRHKRAQPKPSVKPKKTTSIAQEKEERKRQQPKYKGWFSSPAKSKRRIPRVARPSEVKTGEEV